MNAVNSENNGFERSEQFSVEETVERLCQLAAFYRGYCESPDKQSIVVAEYTKLFNLLYSAGTLPILDFECLLPDEFLPDQFVEGLGLSNDSPYRRI